MGQSQIYDYVKYFKLFNKSLLMSSVAVFCSAWCT